VVLRLGPPGRQVTRAPLCKVAGSADVTDTLIAEIKRGRPDPTFRSYLGTIIQWPTAAVVPRGILPLPCDRAGGVDEPGHQWPIAISRT
jgi:hypothetical protein